MNINFEIPDLETRETELLKSIFQCDEINLTLRLNLIATAAFEEYRKMILGQKVFTRGRDIQEYRLYILIKYLYEGRIPEEQKICDLFQITASESRSLMRSIMSKYQYDLRDCITQSIIEEIKKIQKAEHAEYYRLSIQNQYIRDELNRILGSIDTSLPIIEKEKGTISTYIIKSSSYQELIKHFNITSNE